MAQRGEPLTVYMLTDMYQFIERMSLEFDVSRSQIAAALMQKGYESVKAEYKNPKVNKVIKWVD